MVYGNLLGSPMSKGRLVFAHRYKWTHDKRRRVLRKALKEGEVELVERQKDGWLYRVPDTFKKDIKAHH